MFEVGGLVCPPFAAMLPMEQQIRDGISSRYVEYLMRGDGLASCYLPCHSGSTADFKFIGFSDVLPITAVGHSRHVCTFSNLCLQGMRLKSDAGRHAYDNCAGEHCSIGFIREQALRLLRGEPMPSSSVRVAPFVLEMVLEAQAPDSSSTSPA